MAMPAQMEREDLAGARVLVVEDEFVIALEVEVLLRDFGCEVLGPVPSVVRALELLGRERPDAAPLDLDLLDGMAVPVAELLATPCCTDAAGIELHQRLSENWALKKPSRLRSLAYPCNNALTTRYRPPPKWGGTYPVPPRPAPA